MVAPCAVKTTKRDVGQPPCRTFDETAKGTKHGQRRSPHQNSMAGR
ncbi:hypothetical protein L903_08915 [Agrobacterium sp. JL28]|nr:hypothetical protein L904_08700 [Agrobacterium sp. LY4]KVK44392.1 hypothetical protein L903_08915 [Agrobacterium sp. JL28]